MKKEKDNIVPIPGVIHTGGEQNDPNSFNRKRKKKKKIIGLSILIISIIGIGVMIATQLQTYTSVKVLQTYTGVTVTNSNYEAFESGCLRYGKDGVAYITDEGQAIWNYSYEISNPIIVKGDKSAAIADSGGNKIIVMDETGVKGEIDTILPIEKIAISEQGIVAALLTDGTTPQIICYDAVGNVLVTHKASFSGTGYPLDLALSPDGTTLLVTYLQVTEEGILSVYTYYDFSSGDMVSNNVIGSGEKEEVLIADVYFLDNEHSVMISSEGVAFFQGEKSPELLVEIEIEEKIKSVFSSEELIGLIIEQPESGTYALVVYNNKGEEKLSEVFIGNYTNAEIIDNEIILYEGQQCLIYSIYGIKKFEGMMETDILGIFPIFGINKYTVIGNEEINKIRLVG